MAGNVTRRLARLLARGQRRYARWIETATVPVFANEARGFEMRQPRTISHPRQMRIGSDVKLGANSILKCQTRFPGGWMKDPEGRHVTQTFEPSLVIGDRVTATHGLQVVVFDSVTIEDDVMFAGNVFVADGTHAFETADVPYKFQGIFRIAPITIGRGSWIGQNAVITPGVTIGDMAIVGANSLVNQDVPARTIVGGVPARIVRRWDAASNAWVRPDHAS